MPFLNVFSPSKITNRLSQTSNHISSSINNLFVGKKLDENVLEELEDVLIASDIGIYVAQDIISSLKDKKFSKEVNELEVKEFLLEEINDILAPCQKPFGNSI